MKTRWDPRSVFPVPWVRGLALPARFSAEIDEPDEPFVVKLEIVVRDGRPTCSQLVLSQREGGAPVSTRELREVSLARYVATVAGAVAMKPRVMSNGSVTYEPMSMSPEGVSISIQDVIEDVVVIDPPKGPRSMSDEHLAEVARVYREALERGSNAPRKAVEGDPRWPRISPATAGRWVQAARRRGFLGEALPRRAGEVAKRKHGHRSGPSTGT